MQAQEAVLERDVENSGQSHYGDAWPKMPKRRLDQHAVVIRRDNLPIAVSGDDRSRARYQLQAAKVLDKAEIHTVGDDRFGHLEETLGVGFDAA